MHTDFAAILVHRIARYLSSENVNVCLWQDEALQRMTDEVHKLRDIIRNANIPILFASLTNILSIDEDEAEYERRKIIALCPPC